MHTLFPVMCVAFSAFYIWLGVRIINRRERWAIELAIVVPILLVIIGACFLPSTGHPIEYSWRSQCKNNLKSIGLALHNYHERYRCFPPAFVADKNGRPMHSWRVLILPYLDQQSLYEKYRFDEPWDGPNNRKLADSIVPQFFCSSDKLTEPRNPSNASAMTSYVAIVGHETAWPDSGTASVRDFSDGTSNTLLVVEVANSGIHWMEPRDLHVVQMAPTINPKSGQGISSRHKEGAHGLFADGAARFIADQLTADEIRAWLTRRAGDESQ